MKNVYNRLIVIIIVLLLCNSEVFSQTLTDGPIQLQVRLRDVSVGFNETDASLLGVGFSPDEPVVRVWAQDNADLDGQGWLGGTCHDYKMGTGAAIGLPGITPPINEMLINHTYPTANVPQYFDVRVEAFEDDNPSDQLLGFCSNGQLCANDATQCCGLPVFGVCLGLNEGDDKGCNGNPFKTQMPYRNGPPCQWHDQGYVTGTCGTDWRPGIETFWRYTKGTSCADAIDLGTIASAGTLSHFNSNECYSNTHAASPGNDVWYKFHANNAIGITATLCGSNGATFDSYLYLYSSCGATVADTANDDACSGTQSSLAYSICQAGDYYLVVDGKTAGDMGTFTIQVIDNPGFVFSVTANPVDVSCFGGSDGQITTTINGGTPAYTYSWSNSAGNVPSVSGLAGGVYSVTVSDSKGCQASTSTQINVPASITATASSTPVTCGGACDGSATVTAQGGTTPYGYAWNSLPPQQLQTAILLCANNYTVTVTDTKGCSVTATTAVLNTTTIIITQDSLKNVQCFGAANGGVYISATGGVAPLSYNWSNSISTEDNPNLGPGNYSLTITDQSGCTAGNTYTITEPPVLAATVPFTFDPRCNGGSDGIVNVSVNGGVQPYTYLWGAPTNATTQNLNNVVAGSHSVTVSDLNNCTVTAGATLNQPIPYNVTITVGNLQCYGDSNGTASVTVSGATSPYTYFWSNFSTAPGVNGLHTGPFSVVIEDARGCDTIATGTVGSPAAVDVQLTPVEPLCAGTASGSITSNITGGTAPFTYSWTGTGNFTSTAANPQVGSGTYNVTVTDVNNCTATENTAVSTPTPLSVVLRGNNPNCIGDSSGTVLVENPIGGTPPYHYTWSKGASDSSYLFDISQGTYSVTVTDANNCTGAGQITISDPDENASNCGSGKNLILVPTAFSPNGDNINDKLIVIMKNVQKLSMRVYNRWGEEVYYNANMQVNDGWDGVFKGKEQPMGTYIWYCDVTYYDGTHANESNNATLVR